MASSSETNGVCVESNCGVVLPASENYAEQACEALRAGKLIAVPTDTLYGFACDAWYGLKLRISCYMFLPWNCLIKFPKETLLKIFISLAFGTSCILHQTINNDFKKV